jgi:hypothetical protein
VIVVGILNIIFAREFLQQEDITWALINEFICDIIERNLSAFIANLPALWLLVVQLRKRYTSYTESHRSHTGYAPRVILTDVERSVDETMTNKAEVIGGGRVKETRLRSGGRDAYPVPEYELDRDSDDIPLRAMPQYPSPSAHQIRVQTEVRVRGGPRVSPVPLKNNGGRV